MTLDIQEQLKEDLKTAMKARDKLRVDVIRMARAALQQAQLDATKQRFDATAREIEQRLAGDQAAIDAAMASLDLPPQPLDLVAQQQVLAKEAKRRRDSAAIYRQHGQEERAAAEEAEAAILDSYLPRQLTADELRPTIAALISEHGLRGAGDLGKLMPLLMERFKGQAEGRLLSQLARELLTSGA